MTAYYNENDLYAAKKLHEINFDPSVYLNGEK